MVEWYIIRNKFLGLYPFGDGNYVPFFLTYEGAATYRKKRWPKEIGDYEIKRVEIHGKFPDPILPGEHL